MNMFLRSPLFIQMLEHDFDLNLLFFPMFLRIHLQSLGMQNYVTNICFLLPLLIGCQARNIFFGNTGADRDGNTEATSGNGGVRGHYRLCRVPRDSTPMEGDLLPLSANVSGRVPIKEDSPPPPASGSSGAGPTASESVVAIQSGDAHAEPGTSSPGSSTGAHNGAPSTDAPPSPQRNPSEGDTSPA